jgi:hypothetical protein
MKAKKKREKITFTWNAQTHTGEDKAALHA